jgi:hypothetical protein
LFVLLTDIFYERTIEREANERNTYFATNQHDKQTTQAGIAGTA